MLRITFLFLFIASLGFSQDKNKVNDPLNVKTFVLKNGLTVMLSENHNTPQVFGVVAVKAGGKNDPKDATGMAHYLEHMLFKGTKTLGTWNYEAEAVHLKEIENLYEQLGKTTDAKLRAEIQTKINDAAVKAGEYAIPNEMDRMLSEIGSTKVNAFTTEDFTAYYNEFPANKLDEWLQIYDHRFEEPVFRLFQSELETVYEEKNRSMDSPFSTVLDEFNKKRDPKALERRIKAETQGKSGIEAFQIENQIREEWRLATQKTKDHNHNKSTTIRIITITKIIIITKKTQQQLS
jgi:predicted Zn-dependent peptidase